MKLKFVKDKTDKLWRVKLPFFTRHQRLMVCGADLFLEHIDKATDNDGTVTIDFSTKKSNDYLIRLDLIDHDMIGGTYAIKKENRTDIPLNSRLWLCNVTHFVLGHHPEKIYINSFN